MSDDAKLYRWKTFDFYCEHCDTLHEGVLCRVAVDDPPPDWHWCTCGEPARRQATFGSNMKVALPDGNRRLDPIRRQRAIQKEERKANRKGDKRELARLRAEKDKLKGRT